MKSAVRLDTKNAFLQDKLGDVYSELGRYEEAVGAYDRAIRLDRGFALAYRSKAAALEKQGRQQEALAAYGEALASFDKELVSRPEDFFLHFFRADVLTHLDRYEEANETFDRAQRLAPHPLVAVQCIFARGMVRTRAEAKARLQAAGKEVTERAITAEIELMHKEKKLEPLTSRSAALFKRPEMRRLRHNPWIVLDHSSRRIVLAVDGRHAILDRQLKILPVFDVLEWTGNSIEAGSLHSIGADPLD